MARTLLQRWLDHYDPIHRGWTPAGIANGVCATNGFCFPRVAGGYNLAYTAGVAGGKSVPAILAERICGASSPTAADPTAIGTFDWHPLPSDSVLHFRVVALSPGGAADGNQNTVRVETDGDGVPIAATPNPVARLYAAARAGGKVALSWGYDGLGESTAPVGFKVYHNNGAGDPTILLKDRPGGGVSGHLTEAYSHGTVVTFAVRPYGSGGGMAEVYVTATVTADAQGPSDLAAPVVADGEET